MEIQLGTYSTEQQAKKIKETLDGDTYYDFEVDYGIVAGNYPVTVTANNVGENTREDVKDLIIYCLATSL